MNIPTTIPFVSKVASSYQGATKSLQSFGKNYVRPVAKGVYGVGKAFIKAETGQDDFTQKVSRQAKAGTIK